MRPQRNFPLPISNLKLACQRGNPKRPFFMYRWAATTETTTRGGGGGIKCVGCTCSRVTSSERKLQRNTRPDTGLTNTGASKRQVGSYQQSWDSTNQPISHYYCLCSVYVLLSDDYHLLNSRNLSEGNSLRQKVAWGKGGGTHLLAYLFLIPYPYSLTSYTPGVIEQTLAFRAEVLFKTRASLVSNWYEVLQEATTWMTSLANEHISCVSHKSARCSASLVARLRLRKSASCTALSTSGLSSQILSVTSEVT